ncbi:MAG: hypothetical protein AABW46_03195 [Nanoarchaeota archaeon]
MVTDELIKRNVINLPRKLSLSEAEGLVEYIVRELPGEIRYHSSYHKTLFQKDGRLSIRDGAVDLTVHLKATISSHKRVGAFDTFQFLHSQSDSSRLDAIMFQLVPGWDLQEYRQEIIELWDDVRRLTEQYMKEE